MRIDKRPGLSQIPPLNPSVIPMIGVAALPWQKRDPDITCYGTMSHHALGHFTHV